MDYRKRASTASCGVGSKFAFGQFSYGVTHEVSDAWSKSSDSRDRGEVDGRLVTLTMKSAPGIRRCEATTEITSAGFKSGNILYSVRITRTRDSHGPIGTRPKTRVQPARRHRKARPHIATIT